MNLTRRFERLRAEAERLIKRGGDQHAAAFARRMIEAIDAYMDEPSSPAHTPSEEEDAAMHAELHRRLRFVIDAEVANGIWEQKRDAFASGASTEDPGPCPFPGGCLPNIARRPKEPSPPAQAERAG